VLATGFVNIAVVVSVDLVGATVALAVLAALTAFATLLVAPAPSAMRLAAYFAIGVQGFVLSALLIARQGGASLVIGEISPGAIGPGTVLAAAAGAALFGGLYPFVPWRYRRARFASAEGEALRGLLAMPVGVAASLILLRLLGATNIDLSTLGLPDVDISWRLVLVALVLIALLLRTPREGRPSPRSMVLAVLMVALLLGYPVLGWSHVMLAAAFVTLVYAAAVSLALPEEWEVARHDVTLATLWIAFACGTPVALAAGLFVLVGAALGALAESVWVAPHRAYITTVVTVTWTVAGVLGVGIGAFTAPDLASAVAATAAVVLVLLLQLVHAGRRLAVGEAPAELQVVAATAGLVGTALLASILDVPISTAVGQLGRPLGSIDPIAGTATVLVATIGVIGAGTLRPLLPDVEGIVSRLQRFVSAADPVPAGLTAFRALERAVTISSAGFAVFEQRAGVWLATVLIVALLVWSTRQ
jgi:hypothetical protein